mmetsp:Transcript_54471/g.133148  ORF Transcript_54471/g.133148 Transcript_54471/m.133148 type:complete len:249 (-) Transcript_54471:1348-2094(-)
MRLRNVLRRQERSVVRVVLHPGHVAREGRRTLAHLCPTVWRQSKGELRRVLAVSRWRVDHVRHALRGVGRRRNCRVPRPVVVDVVDRGRLELRVARHHVALLCLELQLLSRSRWRHLGLQRPSCSPICPLCLLRIRPMLREVSERVSLLPHVQLSRLGLIGIVDPRDLFVVVRQGRTPPCLQLPPRCCLPVPVGAGIVLHDVHSHLLKVRRHAQAYCVLDEREEEGRCDHSPCQDDQHPNDLHGELLP